MNTPQHVAFILDGNRRWATQKNLPKIQGHHYGAEALKHIVSAVIQRGIPVVSFYTFSTENWRRSPEEVSWLMHLLGNMFRDYASRLRAEGVQIRISGRIADFSESLQQILEKAVAETKENAKLVANFCLSYGGREEIEHMVKQVALETKGDPQAVAAINEAAINERMYTRGLPDVDLLIRTGGEKRLSGFLPWQSTYAELYFTDVMWPDFSEVELDKALADFSTRKRNFGA